MKTMVIYQVTPDMKMVAVRRVTVNKDFCGFGRHGTMNMPEFKKLAEDLEPGISRIHVEVTSL